MDPRSPLARGWIALAVVIGIWFNTVVNGIAGDVTGNDDAGSSGQDLPPIVEFFSTMPNWVFYGAMALVAAVVAGVGAVYVWWFTRYQVTDTHVRLRTGLIFRQERQTRLDRVQALDIQRPLLPRLLGLAELRFEVADAGETSVALRYLKHDHARRLRKDLLGAIGAQGSTTRAASSSVGDEQAQAAVGADEAGAEEELILALPMRRVIAARLLTVSFLVLVLVAVSVTVLAFVFPRVILAMLAGFVPTVLALGATVFKALEVSWGFKMFRTPEGVRLRYGLLNKTSQTVPTGRVQALALYRPPLWRWAGWSVVHVNVAGYGGGPESSGGGDRAVLLPVATDDDLRLMFGQALALSDGDHVAGLAVEGLAGEADPDSRFRPAPARARWVAPIVRRRYGYTVTRDMVIARAGRAYRMCFVVPHNKIQSIGMERGPLARAMKLTDVNLHSIAGPVRTFVAKMDQAEAEAFVVDQLQRGRLAVAAATRDANSPRNQSPASQASDLPPLPWARTQVPTYAAPSVPAGMGHPSLRAHGAGQSGEQQ